MEKNRLGNTDIFVTPIGLGVLTIGNTQLDLPLEEGAEIVRYAYEKGINLFDTAQYYQTYKYVPLWLLFALRPWERTGWSA